MAEFEIYEKSPAEYKLIQRRAKRGMRSQIIMFSLMIFLTLISFTIVTAFQADVAGFSKYLVIPIVLLFAGVQVALQLYYFMHMKEKEHGFAAMFIYVGALIAFLTVLTFLTIVWWYPMYV